MAQCKCHITIVCTFILQFCECCELNKKFIHDSYNRGNSVLKEGKIRHRRRKKKKDLKFPINA